MDVSAATPTAEAQRVVASPPTVPAKLEVEAGSAEQAEVGSAAMGPMAEATVAAAVAAQQQRRATAENLTAVGCRLAWPTKESTIEEAT